jgi:FtsH ternary system-associated peptide
MVNIQPSGPDFVFVPGLPDLITPEEYDAHPDGRLVRLEISVTEDGVQVLGDAFRPVVLEQLFTALGAGPIEEMLCG